MRKPTLSPLYQKDSLKMRLGELVSLALESDRIQAEPWITGHACYPLGHPYSQTEKPPAGPGASCEEVCYDLPGGCPWPPFLRLWMAAAVLGQELQTVVLMDR